MTPRLRAFACAVLWAASVACGGGAISSASPSSLAEHDAASPPAEIRAPRANRYVAETRSPVPAERASDEHDPARVACGIPDAALDAVALRLVADGDRDPDHVTTLLRESGEPHVRPRIVRAASTEEARATLPSMRHATTRCGLAVDGTGVVAVLVDAAADLDPLPTHARTGAWLTFAASLHVAVSGAKLVVLGPRGAPRTIPIALERARGEGRVRGRFALEAPGAFTVQLVGDLPGGPEPLLEARIFADVPDDDEAAPAPGEEAANDADALERMTAVLRSSEGLAQLRRSADLDAIAEAHAMEMRAAGRIAHDVGRGDLVTRLDDAGLTGAGHVGENVARARTVALAHRALHASPSHRSNLLDARFRRAGFAALAGGGEIYVCQIFADR